MTGWVGLTVSVVGGLLLCWLVLVVVLWRETRRHGQEVRLRDLLRLVPDVARLLKRLVGDRSVPLGARIWLLLLLAYLASPIDLIPDFIPVIGYADDAIVVALALRLASRRAGRDALEQHWPGTPEGLATVLRLAGLRPGH
jgi:uncharacterized membrane protein YkvA (DUF1232 family)